jgi:hypothetical protein
MLGEDRPLGAREVVLRQGGDLLKELRPALVVEEPRRQRLLPACAHAEAAHRGAQDSFIDRSRYIPFTHHSRFSDHATLPSLQLRSATFASAAKAG